MFHPFIKAELDGCSISLSVDFLEKTEVSGAKGVRKIIFTGHEINGLLCISNEGFDVLFFLPFTDQG